MDLSKLSTGDKVLAGSGLALFIFSFLPWFGVSGYSGSGNGWDVGFFTGTLPALIGLVLLAYVIVTKVLEGVTLPDGVPYPLVILGLAGLAALLVVIRLLIGYKVDAGFTSFKLDRKFGLYLATLAALGLAAGGFLKFQEDGGEFPTKKTGTGTGTGTDGGAPTPF